MSDIYAKMDDERTRYAEDSDPLMAEAPLAQDVHIALNQVSEIDAQIIHLRKRRAQIITRIENGMNEVQKHFSTVVHSTKESDMEMSASTRGY